MKTKYFYLIVATIIVSSTILLYSIHTNSERKITQQFQDQQSNRVSYITMALKEFLTERLNTINVISSLISLQNMDMNKIKDDIRSYYNIEKNNSVQTVCVCDKNGTIIYSTSKNLIGSNNSGYDLFKWGSNIKNKDEQRISTEFQITDSLTEEQANLNLLVTTPVYKKTSGYNALQESYEFLGVITITIKLDEILSSFFTLLKGYSLTEDFYIIDSSGTLIYSNHHPEMIINNIYSNNKDCYDCHETFSYFKTILSKKDGTITYVSNDEHITSSFSSINIENISWKTVVWIPSYEVSEVILENLYLTLILSIIFLIIIFISGILIINNNKSKIKAAEELKQIKIQKEFAESIKLSEDKFQSLIKQSPYIIEIYDLNGLQISVNNAYEELWGFPAERTLFKFNVLKSKEVETAGLLKYIKSAYAGETVSPPEYLFDPTGATEAKGVGRVRWLSTKIYPTKDTSGNVLNIVIIHQDITERKHSEDEMNKLVSIVKNSSELINLSKLDGSMIFINEAGSKMLGIEPHKVQNVNIIDVIPDNLKEYTKTEIIPTLLKGETWEGDYQYRNIITGKFIDVHAMTFPIKDLNTGKPIYLANVSRDISQRIHAEKIQKVLYNISNAVIISDDLSEFIGFVQKELGAIIDTANFYVALYNPQTETMSVPFYSDEKDKVTTFPAASTLTYHLLKSKKSLLVKKEEIKKLEKLGEIKHFGTYAEVWLGVPLKFEVNITGVLAVQSYTDKNAYTESDMELLEFVSEHISILIERKKTEQDLTNALIKATESDRLKSVFLATMSHELRTPLSAIIGFSDIINKDMSIDNILKFIKKINSCGSQLQGIIEDLFDITLIESGQVQIQKENTQLKPLLDEVNEIMKFEQLNINKPNVSFVLDNSSQSESLVINTDRSKLKQILINLLKNAFRFTFDGHINYGYNIETINGKSMLKFYIADTGIGIPKDKQELIFDMFMQVDDSSTRTYGGTGIGLSIAKKLTEYLGGEIWLESTEDKQVESVGSTFYFTIPIEESEDVGYSKETDRDVELEKFIIGNAQNILIVEDNEDHFDFLEYVLNKPGINIIRANNGEESVKLCKDNNNIDLVLMDINLPIMNGYEATSKIKKIRPNLPIIAQTARAISGEREKALEAGCDDYISKPFKKEVLIEMINNLLKKKKSD